MCVCVPVLWFRHILLDSYDLFTHIRKGCLVNTSDAVDEILRSWGVNTMPGMVLAV